MTSRRWCGVRWPLRSTVLVSICQLGCVTDHDFLKERPSRRGDASASATASPPVGTPGAEGGVEVTPPDEEPTSGEIDGPRSLTVIQGIVDEGRPVVLCLSRVGGSVVDPPLGDPFPAGGLRYGERVVVGDGDPLDLENDGFQVHVIAGDIARIEGLPCDSALEKARAIEAEALVTPAEAPPDASAGGAEAGTKDASAADGSKDTGLADASNTDARTGGAGAAGSDAAGDGAADAADSVAEPPPIRVASLSVIPERSLSSARSYLMVIAGCLGGPALSDSSERSVCGDLYGPLRPTVSPLLVSLSRMVDPGAVGLQTLNASLAFSSAKFIARPPESSSVERYDLATGVSVGEIIPVRPIQAYPALTIGANGAEALLQVYASGGDKPTFETTWQQARTRGGVDELRDGRAYTVVLVGPHPSFAPQKWWNGPMLSLIDNDPLAD